MKIGIITLALHTNYGGILQAYALQTVLERLGHDASEIELNREIGWPSYPPLWKLPLVLGKRMLLKYVWRRKGVRIFRERYERKAYPLLRQHTQRFISQYINQSKVNHLSECKGKYDAFVCGSDQVWRYVYNDCFEYDMANAYLKFQGDEPCKRIAYAASFGTEEWEYPKEVTAECKTWIQKFDAVSVRESSGTKLCAAYFDVKAKHVLDPTMLLASDDYMSLVKSAGVPRSNGNLFCYILDESKEKTEVARLIEDGLHLKPFFMNDGCGIHTDDLEKRIQPTVEAWLRAFNDSEFVVTDSFHACVFSILFHRQFVVIGNPGRGLARIHSLLSIFGLEDRLVSSDSLDTENLPPIDYDKVDAVLNQWRADSMRFLTTHLK